MRRPRERIFDTDLIRRRRNELRLSRDDIERATGIQDRKLLGLENGENHGGWRADEIILLARSLGVEPGELFELKRTLEPAEDDARLEAAILLLKKQVRGSTIRRALDMTEKQYKEAADRLAERLRGTGAILAFNGAGFCRITARRSILTDKEIEDIQRPTNARDDITIDQARVLKRILDGDGNVRRLTTQAKPGVRMALGWLENNGYIRLDDDTYKPTQELLFNLGLNDVPPRKKKRR